MNVSLSGCGKQKCEPEVKTVWFFCGKYEVFVVASKYSSEFTFLDVKEKYDYWVLFPGSVTL